MACKHSILDPKCPNCVALSSQWEKRLKEEGLADIENKDGYLIRYDADFFNRSNLKTQAGGFEIKAEYYRSAGIFLYEHQFDNPIEKHIWDLHSQGLSIPQTYEKINKLVKKDTIKKVLNVLKKKMKEHKWK